MEDFDILDALDEASDFDKTILPILHPKVREFVEKICDEIKVPPQWVFFAVLNVLSALAGESRILIGDTHLERAVQFHILRTCKAANVNRLCLSVGPGSSRKSALCTVIRKSLKEAEDAITKELKEDAERLMLSVDIQYTDYKVRITKQELSNILIRNTRNRYILTMLADEMLATFPFIETEKFIKSRNSNELDKDLLMKLSEGSDLSFLTKNNGDLSRKQVPYISMSVLGFEQPAVFLKSFSDRDTTGFWQRFDIIPGRRVFIDHERVVERNCRIVDMVRRECVNSVESLSVSSPVDSLNPKTSFECEATVENITKESHSSISRLSKLWTSTYAFTGQKRLFLVDGDTYVNVFMD
ncbi:hypothetical protein BKA69DRAFT_1042618 [Paraphysoderma sedebokerense]|nr:hypothetical protein BKA69DRAFT_1042618 [Paraphysoderma sedebokerense]